MSKLKALLLLLLMLAADSTFAQGGFHFGTKTGMTVANQNWNGGERRPLLVYHANVFIESRDPEGKGSLFAQVGYHQRGSSFIGFRNLGRNNVLGFKFNNLSLLMGAKGRVKKEVVSFGKPYYFLGIRGEYSISNNLESIAERQIFLNNLNTQNGNSGFTSVVDPVFANKFTYGISMGGGFEFSGSKYFNAALEFTFSPDLSFQYNQLPGANPTDPSERQVRNINFEMSLVLRFLREVIYE